jgi:hypothetical protein
MFPPRLATPGLEHVGYWLLKAATPPCLAPAFNQRRGELWVSVQAARTVPKPSKFETEMQALRDLLRERYSRPFEEQTKRDEMVRSARCLDKVEAFAALAGLTP